MNSTIKLKIMHTAALYIYIFFFAVYAFTIAHWWHNPLAAANTFSVTGDALEPPATTISWKRSSDWPSHCVFSSGAHLRGPKVQKLRVPSGWAQRNMIRNIVYAWSSVASTNPHHSSMIIHPSIPCPCIPHPPSGNVIGYSLHPVYLASWGSQVPNCFRHHLQPLLLLISSLFCGNVWLIFVTWSHLISSEI